MHHRCCHKCKSMFTKCKSISLFDNNSSVLELCAKKIAHHCKSLCTGNNHCIRIVFHETHDIGTMVGFHMLNNQIIRLSSLKYIIKVIKPLMLELAVNCIHNRNFFINYYIRIISHSIRYNILSFKQVNLVVIYACIFNVIGYCHSDSSL